MAGITFEGVSKVYGDGTRAVDDLDLDIQDGEFLVLVGPSGCGKTSALRMVAGLEEISAGAIRVGDTVVNNLQPSERDIAMVFQNYALYPHMSVFENIAFPLRSRRVPRAEVRRRVERTAQVLGISEHLKRKPKRLSGGQRQRVAMGRAIVREPRAFLMDEPLSNLDAKLRMQMRAEISRLQLELGVTTIYVTHDQVEAMTMGSRIGVMRKGVLQQQGPPQQVYDAPVNLFVATFMGSPGMNLLRGQVGRNGTGLVCRLGSQELPLDDTVLTRHPQVAAREGGDVAVGIRPEHLKGDPREGQPTLRVKVLLTEPLGAERLVHCSIDAQPVLTEDVLEIARDIDATTAADLTTGSAVEEAQLIGRVDPTYEVAPGTVVDIGVDAHRLQFFDLGTGTAL
jgi:multiple sugar transport system ATP-binding protein